MYYSYTESENNLGDGKELTPDFLVGLILLGVARSLSFVDKPRSSTDKLSVEKEHFHSVN